MIRNLLLIAALLVPTLASAAGLSATLSVQVVPTISSGSGALSGSILPAGNWVNDLDEHFPGSSLSGIWEAGTDNAPGSGGESNCQVPGVMVFNNPGLTLYALPYDTVNNSSNGCFIDNPISGGGYSSPGYFESRLKMDTAPQSWNGYFFEFGNNSSCRGDIAQNGGEVDVVETWVVSYYFHFGGYASCTQAPNGGGYPIDGQFHVWGLDFGDNGAVTFYRDGVEGWQYAPGDGVEPGTCPPGSIRCSNGNWNGQFIFWNFLCFQSYCGQTESNGLTIDWVRHYHH